VGVGRHTHKRPIFVSPPSWAVPGALDPHRAVIPLNNILRIVRASFVKMPGIKRRRVSAKSNGGYVVSKSSKASSGRVMPTKGIMSSFLSKRLLSPFPEKIRTTMRYFSGPFNLNGGAGGLAANHVWSANGLFDPDVSGGGHQVIGFDQLSVIYSQYTVVASKCVMDIRNDDTSNPYNVGIRVSDDTTVLADPQQIVENGYNVYKLLNLAPQYDCIARLSQNVDIAKFLGRKDIMDDPEVKGGPGFNPTEQVLFHTFAFTLGNVDGGSITGQVCLEYDVYWHERRPVLTS